MPLDPEAFAFVDARSKRDIPPTHLQTPVEHRGYIDAGPFAAGPALFEVTPLMIPGEGKYPSVSARLYRPSLGKRLPTHLYIHGGGWMAGTLDLVDETMRHLAQRSGHLVVSVTYRRAPENKFPSALEDCFHASEWLTKNVEALGGDPERLTIGGSSAGANLAAAVMLMRRDLSLHHYLGQVLVVPCLDPACSSQSFRDNATGYVLTAEGMRWFWSNYLRDEADRLNPYAAPLLSSDLTRLPQALIVTAEYDPLRDDGKRYAQALVAAGVSTRYEECAGMVHNFFGVPSRISGGLSAINTVAAWLVEKARNAGR